MKVVDASVGFKWLVPEQDSDKALALQASEELHAPELFQIEITNVLHVCTIKGRIVDTQALLNALMLQLPNLHDSAPLLPRALEIATQARRSVYDSLYIALAEREGCELVTADQKLYNSVKSQFPFVVELSSLP
jgi:predicted nucleic acid-binding protein